MNFVDIIIIVIILFFGYRGFKNGLIRELGGLVALIAGIFLAIRFSDLIFSITEKHVNVDAELIPVISFAIIFIAVVVVVLMFSKVLDKFVKVIKLDWLNKIAGVVFSSAKTVIILGGLFFLTNQIIASLNFSSKALLTNSTLYNLMIDVFEFGFPYLDHITI